MHAQQKLNLSMSSVKIEKQHIHWCENYSDGKSSSLNHVSVSYYFIIACQDIRIKTRIFCIQLYYILIYHIYLNYENYCLNDGCLICFSDTLYLYTLILYCLHHILFVFKFIYYCILHNSYLSLIFGIRKYDRIS